MSLGSTANVMKLFTFHCLDAFASTFGRICQHFLILVNPKSWGDRSPTPNGGCAYAGSGGASSPGDRARHAEK